MFKKQMWTTWELLYVTLDNGKCKCLTTQLLSCVTCGCFEGNMPDIYSFVDLSEMAKPGLGPEHTE